MVDTIKIADDIDGLADRQIKAGGMKLTMGSVMAIFAFLSKIVGGLYGGFVLYQKIEAVAGLDLDEYQQNMPRACSSLQDVFGGVASARDLCSYTRLLIDGKRP